MKPPSLGVFYRGPLSSCNYDCSYCPFAKKPLDPEEVQADERSLRRFVDWVEGQPAKRLRILFTPWGEGLYHKHYQDALVKLSHLGFVECVGVQTNGSGPVEFLRAANRGRVSLWISFHPGEVAMPAFLARCEDLSQMGVPFSVGIVGLKEHVELAEQLRQELTDATYVWVNAYKAAGADYYSDQEVARWTAIDPWFEVNLRDVASHGRECEAGRQNILVDGEGNVARCHFVNEVIGNIQDPGCLDALGPRLCPNRVCDCYIGHVNVPELGLDEGFGPGLLVRNPMLRGREAVARDR